MLNDRNQSHTKNHKLYDSIHLQCPEQVNIQRQKLNYWLVRTSLVAQTVSVCLQCGRPGFDPWVGKILWRRKWQPTPVLLPGKSNGQRSVVSYSPWVRKELDTTEWLHSRAGREGRLANDSWRVLGFFSRWCKYSEIDSGDNCTTPWKLLTPAGSLKKQESSIKSSTFALLTTPKPLTVWITTNCEKFLKGWEYQTTWSASWEICMQVKKKQWNQGCWEKYQ